MKRAVPLSSSAIWRMNKGNTMVLTFLRRVCAVASCTLFATQIEAAEKLISTNLDTRTVLAFRVPNEVVRKLLPAGWELDATPDGPNLRIVCQQPARSGCGRQGVGEPPGSHINSPGEEERYRRKGGHGAWGICVRDGWGAGSILQLLRCFGGIFAARRCGWSRKVDHRRGLG
jgi:hypothetical protein